MTDHVFSVASNLLLTLLEVLASNTNLLPHMKSLIIYPQTPGCRRQLSGLFSQTCSGAPDKLAEFEKLWPCRISAL